MVPDGCHYSADRFSQMTRLNPIHQIAAMLLISAFEFSRNSLAALDPEGVNVRPFRRRLCLEAKNFPCRNLLKLLHRLEVSPRTQICQHLVAGLPDAQRVMNPVYVPCIGAETAIGPLCLGHGSGGMSPEHRRMPCPFQLQPRD